MLNLRKAWGTGNKYPKTSIKTKQFIYYIHSIIMKRINRRQTQGWQNKTLWENTCHLLKKKITWINELLRACDIKKNPHAIQTHLLNPCTKKKKKRLPLGWLEHSAGRSGWAAEDNFCFCRSNTPLRRFCSLSKWDLLQLEETGRKQRSNPQESLQLHRSRCSITITTPQRQLLLDEWGGSVVKWAALWAGSQ